MNRFAEWAGGLAAAFIATLVGLLYRKQERALSDHARRLRSLEQTAEIKVDADKQREALREDVRRGQADVYKQIESLRDDMNDRRTDIIADVATLGSRLETVRIEANTKLDKLTDSLSALASHLGQRKPE